MASGFEEFEGEFDFGVGWALGHEFGGSVGVG